MSMVIQEEDMEDILHKITITSIKSEKPNEMFDLNLDDSEDMDWASIGK